MPPPQPTEPVFLNVPFDPAYRAMFEAMVFAVAHCGFQPRCALEASDAGHVRVQKIAAIIRDCALGIHDISRTELDKKSRLPRFNMPFELGLFLGAKWFGDDSQRRKNTLILDDSNGTLSTYKIVSGKLIPLTTWMELQGEKSRARVDLRSTMAAPLRLTD